MEKAQKRFDTNGLDEYFPLLYGEYSDYQKDRYDRLLNRFKKEFDCECGYFASSSGRVEVCGNHTDHNGGKVVATTISLDTLGVFLPTDNNIIHIKSEGYPDIVVDIDGEEKEKIGSSSALVRGVVNGLHDYGYKAGGFNACFTSNVIGGCGISSSASFEVLVAEILNFLYNNEKVSNEEKSRIAQFAENKYFGKPCGLLDQTIIAYGGLKMLDFSDTKKIKVTDINNTLKGYTLILIDTGGSHADLTDEYAAIPAEMKSVAAAFGKERLIDIMEEDFYKDLPLYENKLSDRSILRAIHFYDENNRVELVKSYLDNDNYDNFLELINASGISSLTKLQNCYVSGSDSQLIPKALSISKKFLHGGANRVHGGGFAGSILNIVKNEYKDEFIFNMKRFYGEDKIIPLFVRGIGTIIL